MTLKELIQQLESEYPGKIEVQCALEDYGSYIPQSLADICVIETVEDGKKVLVFGDHR